MEKYKRNRKKVQRKKSPRTYLLISPPCHSGMNLNATRQAVFDYHKWLCDSNRDDRENQGVPGELPFDLRHVFTSWYEVCFNPWHICGHGLRGVVLSIDHHARCIWGKGMQLSVTMDCHAHPASSIWIFKVIQPGFFVNVVASLFDWEMQHILCMTPPWTAENRPSLCVCFIRGLWRTFRPSP